MDINNLDIKSILKNRSENISNPKSQRAEIISQIYEYYLLDNKKQNWKNYIKWLKCNKLKHSKDNMSIFKKTKEYHKNIPIKSFCSFWLSHIKTFDLFYILSIAKDKNNRNESFNKWLFWSLKSR